MDGSESTVYIRRVTTHGRVSIPPELRKRFGIRPGDMLEVIEGDHGELIFQRPSDPESAQLESGSPENDEYSRP
jgi:AbrB family looped-hinge helix DNA binding protein